MRRDGEVSAVNLITAGPMVVHLLISQAMALILKRKWVNALSRCREGGKEGGKEEGKEGGKEGGKDGGNEDILEKLQCEIGKVLSSLPVVQAENMIRLLQERGLV